jgi:hypothetical protein
VWHLQPHVDWSNPMDRSVLARKQLSELKAIAASLDMRGVDYDEERLDERVDDFVMRSRRLVHLGEVSYKEHSDPLSLAVSQTFKIEKAFTETHLGCTQAVADAITPKLGELGAQLIANRPIMIAGADRETMSYYVVPRT